MKAKCACCAKFINLNLNHYIFTLLGGTIFLFFLSLSFFLTQYIEAANESPLKEKERLLNILADQTSSSPEEREAVFTLLYSSFLEKESHYFSYCPEETIDLIKEIPSFLYAKIIRSMPIPCVDVFIYNFELKAYLLMKRSTPPAKGEWWTPGGRVFKGESFYQSAVRKTKGECGLDVYPIAQLGTYSTYFSESAWGDGVSTDTKNTAILTLSNAQSAISTELYEPCMWVSIESPPKDPYLFSIYKEAIRELTQMGFIVF